MRLRRFDAEELPGFDLSAAYTVYVCSGKP